MPERFDLINVRDEIRTIGYSTLDGFIKEEEIYLMREYWLDQFRQKVGREPIIWGPYLGEPNRKIFDSRETNYIGP